MVVTEECSLLPRRLSQRNSRVGFCRFVAGCCVLALISIAAIGSSVEEPYAVQHLDLPAISSPMWESHPAIDPITGDLWFVRSDPSFSGWRILVSHCVQGISQPPVPGPIDAPGIEADPYFTPDGRTLYYISSQRTGSRSSADLDIWKVSRDSRGRWLKPERLAEPVNSAFAEWFPRPAADGWLYFGSRRPGGFGQDDIWKAKLDPQGRWTVENAGPEINSPDAEYEFLPSPDGGWALLSTNKGIYRLEHSPGGWTKRLLLGREVNANGTEIGPTLFGRNGSFLFSRDTGSRDSGELFIAYRGSRPSTISRGCFLFPRLRDGSLPH